MKRTTKILLVLSCVFLCAGGAVLSVKESAKEDRAKTKVVPINNRTKNQQIWTWS